MPNNASTHDRVSPAKIRAGLNTNLVGSRIYCFNEVGSTNDTAYKLAQNGAKGQERKKMGFAERERDMDVGYP